MPVVRDTVIPLANYPTGTYNIPVSNVPSWATRLSFDMARCTTATPTIWPNESTTITINIELQIDGGEWRPFLGFTAKGGIASRNGVEAQRSGTGSGLPAGNNRKIRGTVSISNGPLRSEANVEVE